MTMCQPVSYWLWNLLHTLEFCFFLWFCMCLNPVHKHTVWKYQATLLMVTTSITKTIYPLKKLVILFYLFKVSTFFHLTLSYSHYSVTSVKLQMFYTVWKMAQTLFQISFMTFLWFMAFWKHSLSSGNHLFFNGFKYFILSGWFCQTESQLVKTRPQRGLVHPEGIQFCITCSPYSTYFVTQFGIHKSWLFYWFKILWICS